MLNKNVGIQVALFRKRPHHHVIKVRSLIRKVLRKLLGCNSVATVRSLRMINTGSFNFDYHVSYAVLSLTGVILSTVILSLE